MGILRCLYSLRGRACGRVYLGRHLRDGGGMNTYSECQDCGATWRDDRLKEIHHIFARVAPGEPMPSGECPACGALCQPIEDSHVRTVFKVGPL